MESIRNLRQRLNNQMRRRLIARLNNEEPSTDVSENEEGPVLAHLRISEERRVEEARREMEAAEARYWKDYFEKPLNN